MSRKMAGLLAVLLLSSLTAISLTRRIVWDPKDRPRMELFEAMTLAHVRLNMEEGLSPTDDRFYCIGAELAITTSKDGDWTFTFGSKEGVVRYVVVDLDGNVETRREHYEY